VTLRLAAVIMVAAACACAPSQGPVPQGRRVAVVAVEGATWRVLRPLLAEGRLPHLARLYQGGSAGILRADGPLDPQVLATTLATGQPMARHGVAGSVVRAPGRHAVRPASADLRRVPAIWSLADAQGLSVGVAGWPVTFPAEPVRGYMLAPRYDPLEGRIRGFIQPPGALGEGGAARERLAMPGWLDEVTALDAELRDAIERDVEQFERAVSLYRVYQPRLAFFRFAAADLAAHRYWQYFETGLLPLAGSRGRGVPPERAAALSAAVPGAYRFVDACIGLLMERLPEESALLVVSEFGVRGVALTDYLAVDLIGLLERLDLLRRAPDGSIDWASTRVFPMPEAPGSSRRLCLSVRGRDEGGVVDQGSAAALKRDTISRLRGLATRAGQPLFSKVDDVEASGRQDGAEIELTENLAIDPEGVLEIAGEAIEARALYRRVSEDFAVHDPEGILLAAGGGVAAGRHGWSARLEDVAPTLLTLLGLPSRSGMPGRAIAAMLAPPAGAVEPDQEHEALMAPVAPLRRAEEDLQEEVEELRRLGHLR